MLAHRVNIQQLSGGKIEWNLEHHSMLGEVARGAIVVFLLLLADAGGLESTELELQLAVNASGVPQFLAVALGEELIDLGAAVGAFSAKRGSSVAHRRK